MSILIKDILKVDDPVCSRCGRTDPEESNVETELNHFGGTYGVVIHFYCSPCAEIERIFRSPTVEEDF